MSKDINTYKQNRINELRKIFTTNVARLNAILANSIRVIQFSRNRNKQTLINALIVKYNNDIDILRFQLQQSINRVQSFVPEFDINLNKIKNKKALLIGINYLHTPYELSGCIDDTNNMKKLLETHGFTSFEILTDLSSVKPTKSNILSAFKNMIINANAGDILFFYFSGHGSYTYDKTGDEFDGKDEMIITSDLQGLLDDELKNILSNYMKREVTVVGLFDSCHSGTMFDLPYHYINSENYNCYTENTKTTECTGNVIMISGCMDSQTSSEAIINNKVQGALTWSFIECINKKSSLSWRELLVSMRDLLKTNSFSQIPQLTSDSFYDIDSRIFF